VSDFWELWRHLPERIDPVFLRLGALELRYYGLSYVAAFLAVWTLVRRRIEREPLGMAPEDAAGFLPWAVLGVVLGGRFGYVLFYDFAYYRAHPAEIFLPFSTGPGPVRFTGLSGMSYHGGLLGVVAALAGWSAARKIPFWRFADLLAPAVPAGYFFGRIGNFLNGELYGRATALPWGMIFPLDPERLVRHPSQLYEALLEGPLLFAVLWPLRRRFTRPGALACAYLLGYGAARFAAEFAREPDPQIGFLAGGLTMGQLLSAGMMAAGAALYFAFVGAGRRRQ
jgi:phosphatidylglycerol:prolipoprotein diacylglycerol transferase